jgi:hypothetical protein
MPTPEEWGQIVNADRLDHEKDMEYEKRFEQLSPAAQEAVSSIGILREQIPTANYFYPIYPKLRDDKALLKEVSAFLEEPPESIVSFLESINKMFKE